MTALTIEALGLSKDELIERIVDTCAERLLTIASLDDDGNEWSTASPFAKALETKITARIEQSIDDIAAKNVLPNVAAYVESVCLTETNKWGEKVGKPQTFTEFLVSKAEGYLTETVNYEGKAKAEAASFSWSGTQTRISHLVHKHLHFAVETAMKEAVKNANTVIVGGLEKTVRIKLQEVAAALKVEVKTK